eukprot:CAMPEP_0172898350 /NCGR_PEP_ID=MMETSP1075-20121228/159493_1 /TAXON_ID=2916 /ORGANISM="Ceratium fusus, Strain PA161109" /LENGTH=651 /DNA_ID=CAMNT_0013754115 /DNA_START=23 /DNA_END=1978 /DNA_ORIENTATION=+
MKLQGKVCDSERTIVRSDPAFSKLSRFNSGGASLGDTEEDGLIEGAIVEDRALKSRWVPDILSLCVELIFCIVMTVWDAQNRRAVHPQDVSNTDMTIMAYWCVFGSFFLVRAILVVLWKVAPIPILQRYIPATSTAGVLMFFSSFQFVLYLSFYYKMRMAWTHRSEGKPEVLWSYNQTDQLQGSDGGSAAVFTASCAPYSISCHGMFVLGVQRCCVNMTYSAVVPTTVVPWIWSISIDEAYNLLKWMSALAMMWVWVDVPLLKMTSADTEFLNGAWLDILDAVVFGDRHILRKAVLNPEHGLSREGNIQPDVTHMGWRIYTVWFLALVSSLLSPSLYVIMGFRDLGDRPDNKLEDVSADIIRKVQRLDEAGAQKLVSRACALQLKAYADDEVPKHGQRVYVESASLSGTPRRRYGKAYLKRKNPGFYKVIFNDGKEPSTETFGVGALLPDCRPQGNLLRPGCCHNWCRGAYLTPTGKDRADAFERRATFLEAIRSLCLVQLPLGVVRYYFNVSLTGWTSVMLLKNVAWGIVNLMVIASCGNKKATCLSVTPVEYITKLIKGSPLAYIWVGPPGLTRLTSQLAATTMSIYDERKKACLSAHRAWLLLESANLGPEEEDALRRYAEAVEEIDEQIAQIDQDMKMASIAAQTPV